MSLVLQLTSPTLLFTYGGTDRPGDAQYEGWRIREVYAPPPAAEGDQKEHGRYQLLIERELALGDNPSEVNYAAILLAERLHGLWPYVVGSPLERPPIGVTVSLLKPPEGWTSNVEEIENHLGRDGYSIGDLRIGESQSWSSANWWPLVRFLAALEAQHTLSPLDRELIDLYEAANRSTSRRAYAVLISTALEIAYELLPGDSKRERDRLFGEEAGAILTQPPSSLWRQANSHRQTRHAITKRPALALHPEMSKALYARFLRDADALIRYVICDRLGLAAIVVHRG